MNLEGLIMATRNIDGKLLRTMPMLSLDNLFYLYEKEKDIKIIKSTLDCGTLRDEAGKFYNDSSYLESLLYLNKSLCVGIVGTDEYNMTIIGRSLICVFIDADVAALKNVEYLKIGKYPPDTKHHVDNVIKKSTRSLANAVKGDASELLNTPLYNFFYERPSNSPKIKVLSPLIITEGYFTTTKNIKMGDIIAIEQPFFGASFGDSANMNCANCMKFSTFTLIPCDGCTTSNIYNFIIIS